MLQDRENKVFIFLVVQWGYVKKTTKKLGRAHALFEPRSSAFREWKTQRLSETSCPFVYIPREPWGRGGGGGVPESGYPRERGRGDCSVPEAKAETPGRRSFPLRMPAGSSQGRRQGRGAAWSFKEGREGSEGSRSKDER